MYKESLTSKPHTQSSKQRHAMPIRAEAHDASVSCNCEAAGAAFPQPCWLHCLPLHACKPSWQGPLVLMLLWPQLQHYCQQCTCITNHFFSLTDTTASASAILLQPQHYCQQLQQQQVLYIDMHVVKAPKIHCISKITDHTAPEEPHPMAISIDW